MALIERVAMLLRANINDLIDKAEDPSKMVKQLVLDMQNQLLQVKTQVAIAIADQHLLAKKAAEHDKQSEEWRRRAEIAVGKGDDVLARGALERSIASQALATSFRAQAQDQSMQVENLKSMFRKLEGKLTEAQSANELLLAHSRRARAVKNAAVARGASDGIEKRAVIKRVQDGTMMTEARAQAALEMASDSMEDRLAALERDDQVDRLLAEIKSRKKLA